MWIFMIYVIFDLYFLKNRSFWNNFFTTFESNISVCRIFHCWLLLATFYEFIRIIISNDSGYRTSNLVLHQIFKKHARRFRIWYFSQLLISYQKHYSVSERRIEQFISIQYLDNTYNHYNKIPKLYNTWQCEYKKKEVKLTWTISHTTRFGSMVLLIPIRCAAGIPIPVLFLFRYRGKKISSLGEETKGQDLEKNHVEKFTAQRNDYL